jgi:hypothetical protein
MANQYTVAYWESHRSGLDAGPAFNIDDTAANIDAALNTLTKDSNIQQIIISDNAAITITVAQISSDATALSTLINQNGSAAALTVNDTAAHIAASFATIGSDTAVTQIVVNNAAFVTLTASQVANNLSALGKLYQSNGTTPATVTVKDSAANVAANLNALQTAGAPVTSIVISNSNPMTLTAAQIANDGGALAKLVNNNSGAVHYYVLDTAADISNHLAALQANANISSITVSDNASIMLTYAQISSASGALAELQNANSTPYTLTVADTAADIQAAIDTIGGNSHVTKIVLTDNGTITVSASQLASDGTAIGEMYESNGTTHATVTVSDTAANIVSNLAALNSSPYVSKIEVASGTVTVAVTDVINHGTALGELYNANGTQLEIYNVSDTAANISAALGALNSDTQIGKIIVSDSGTGGVVTASVAQLTSDATALGELFQANGTTPATITVSDTSANLSGGTLETLSADSQVTKVVISNGSAVTLSVAQIEEAGTQSELGILYASNGSSQGTVTISDTAANIAADLNALSGNSQVTKIIATDSGLVTVTVAQLTSDATAISELYNSNGTTHASLLVADTAANISSAFGSLNGNSQVSGIVVTDSSSNTVTISAAAAANDTTALGELYLANGATHAEVAVSDLAVNVVSNLAGLESNISDISGIVLTDVSEATLTVTAAQFTSDASVLSAISSPYHLDVTGVSVSQFATVAANSHVGTGAIALSDTAANVQAGLGTLEASVSKIGSVALTDGSTPAITVAYATFTADQAVLADITSSFNLVVTGVSAAGAAGVASATIPSEASLSMTVSDTGANIGANLASLESVVGDISSITPTDGKPDYTLSETNYDSYLSVLGKISGGYLVNLNQVLAADAGTLAGVSSVATIAVSDTAADVNANFASLNTAVTDGKLSSIALTDGTTPTLTVTDTSLGMAQTLNVLAVITSDYDLVGSALTAQDAVALDAFAGSHDTTVTLLSLSVSDTAADVQEYIVALSTLIGSPTLTITLTDSGTPTITLTETQLANDQVAYDAITSAFKLAVTNVLAGDLSTVNSNVTTNGHYQSYTVSVTDTAANVVANTSALNASAVVVAVNVDDSAANVTTNLDSLNSVDHLSITLTDTTPVLTLTYSQLTGGLTALGAITNAAFTVNVTGVLVSTVTNVETDISGLGNHAAITYMIAVSDNASDVGNAESTLNADSHVTSVTVSDTAANISTYIDQLAGVTNLTHVTVNNYGELYLTYAQFTGDSHAFSVMSETGYSNFFYNVTGVTVAQGYDVYYNHLNYIGSNGRLENFFVVDTAANVANGNTTIVYAAAAIQINDTAANVTAVLDKLEAIQPHLIGSLAITLTDSSTPTLSITATQFTNDATVLGEITNSYNLNVSGVTVAQVATVAGNSHVGSGDIQILDTAANVQAGLGALETYVGKISSVTISDITQPTLTITETTYSADSSVLGLVTNKFDLVITSVLAGDAGIIASSASSIANLKVLSLDVSDTAANIVAHLGALNSNPDVAQIAISDGNPLALSATQFVADGTAIGLITGAYTIDITDTAANITTNLNALEASSHIAQVVVSDSGSNAVVTSVAQLTSDSSILSELFDANGTTSASITVSDTTANIESDLGGLNGDTQVTQIVANDLGQGHGFVITVSEAINDGTALGELYDSNGTTRAIVVVEDTGAAISAHFDQLNTFLNSGRIDNISVTSGTVTIDAAQAASDGTALDYLYNSTFTAKEQVTVSDTAANITSAFGALNGNTHVGQIVVSDSNSNEVTLSVSAFTNDTVALGILYDANGTTPANVAISDIAANLQGELGTLNGDSQVNHIIISDNGTLTLSVVEAVTATTAIGELENANSSPVSLTVSDLASNIEEYLSVLNGEANISSIVISDNNPLTLSAAAIGLDTRALALLSNANSSGVEINVVDTAAGISQYLDALQANSDIVSITVSDNAPITVSVATLGNDAVVLSELVNANSSPVVLTVEDTAANIAAALTDLNQNSQVTSVVISDNAALTLTIDQITTDATVLGELSNANGQPYTLNVTDNAAHISSALDTLNGNTHIATITDTNDAAITLTFAQIASDATALSKLVNADTTPYTLSIDDTAVNISNHLNAINGNSRITSIIVSDSNPLHLSVAKVINDTTALGEITNANSTQVTIDVSDTSANVGANFNALNALGSKLAGITFTDSSPVLTITEAQLIGDTTALAAITNASYSIDVTAATAANAVSDANTAHVASIAIVDQVAYITEYIDALEGIEAKISGITLTGGGTTLDITYTQYINDAAVLNEITSPYSLDITGVSAANFASVAANSHTGNNSIELSDTAADVQANLGALEANYSKINYIHLTDVSTPTFTINEATYNADGKVLIDDVGNNFNLVVTGVAAADAAGIVTSAGMGGYLQALTLDISDSAANVATNFDTLNGLGSKLGTITLTDTTPLLTITETQLINDTTALAAITNATYNIDVTAATAAHALSDSTTSHVASVAVVDSSGDVNSNLSSLETVAASSVALTIALTDSVTPTFNWSYGTYAAAAGVRADITSAYHVDVSGATVAEFTTLVTDGHVTQVQISDSAGNVQNGLGTLEANIGQLELINLTNGSTPTFVISETTFNADGNVLTYYVASDYNLTVNTVSAADAAGIVTAASASGELQTLTLNVRDTATNIAANLDALNNNTDVAAIVSTSNTAFTVTAEEAAVDARALGILSNANSSAVSLTVLDTAAHISTFFNTLSSVSTISSIVISDNNPLTLSVADLQETGALAKLSNANGSGVVVNIYDTAAHISAGLNTLESNNSIGTITVSDNAPITVTTAQLTSDNDVIAALVNANAAAVVLTVLDTSTNVHADLGNLEADSQVTSIVLSDNGQLQLTASQFLNDTVVVGELHNLNGNPVTLKLQDTAQHVQASLATFLASNEITSIVISDNAAITLTAAQLSADSSKLGEITNKNGTPVVINISDTAANIAANLATLVADASYLGTITITNNAAVTVSVAQISSDASVIAKFVNQNGSPYTLAVADTAPNIATAANSLNGNSHVTQVNVADFASNVVNVIGKLDTVTALHSITLLDANTPTLTITETQYNASTALLGDIISPYHLAITGAVAADAAGIAANKHVTSIAVSDTSADITAVLTALNSNTDVTSITVSNNAALILSVAQLTADSHALSETINKNATAFTANVTDTGAHLSGTVLSTLETNSHITGITVSDNAAISLTTAQFTGDTAALAELRDASSNTYSLTISDTAANLVNDLDALKANGHVGLLVVTDSQPLDMTYTQYQNDMSVWDKVASAYSIDVTGVTGQTYSEFDETFAAGNVLQTKVFHLNTGALLTQIYASGVSVTSSPTGVTETFTAENGVTGDTFTFNPTFGRIQINNYVPGSESLDFNHTVFANIAAVEAHAASTGAGANTTITLDASDTITLTGVTLSNFEAHSSDWHFI